MILFWILCGVMLILALAIVLWPLLRTGDDEDSGREELNIRIHKDHLKELERDHEAGLIDEQTYQRAVEEIELDLLNDIDSESTEISYTTSRSVKSAAIISLLIPVVVITLYQQLGQPELIESPPVAPHQGLAGEQADGMPTVEEMVAQLEERMQKTPDDPKGWFMLARSYMALERPDDAVMAYRKARALQGDEPQILLNLAESLVVKNGNRFDPEAAALVTQALEIEPESKKALWMSGYRALEQGNGQEALKYWEQLRDLFPADSDDAEAMNQHIADVRKEMGLAEAGNATVPESGTEAHATENRPSQPVAGNTTAIDVHVSISDEVASHARPDDVVFIYARAAEGPRMPLAISRKRVSDLPLTVRLDDSMAMTPAMSLSNFEQVIVGARISKTGNAIAASGDINGSSGIINLTEVLGVRVNIDEIIP